MDNFFSHINWHCLFMFSLVFISGLVYGLVDGAIIRTLIMLASGFIYYQYTKYYYISDQILKMISKAKEKNDNKDN